MKFTMPNFKLPSLSAVKARLAEVKRPDLKVPKHAKWAMALVAGLIGMGFIVYFGYFVLLLAVIVGAVVASYWPGMLGFLVVSSILGGAISRKRETGVLPGVCAGIFYALLVAVVALIGFAVYAVATGAH